MQTVKVDLDDFKPGPTQMRLLRSREPYVLFAGGYGAGKTRSGAEKALRLAIANPGCTGLLVAPTWQMLQRLSLDAFLKACPRQLIAEHHKSERRIELINGARIYFGSADRPGALEGTNLAWAWIDEGRLIGSDAWQVIIGRVRDKRAKVMQTVVTTTPAMGWLSEFFNDTPGRARLHCSTLENAHNLAPGFIERLRASYSPRLAKSLIDGEFSVVAGQVYEEFDDARHLVEWTYDPSLRTGLAVDFGVACPSVLVWQQTTTTTLLGSRVIPAGSVVIFDELQPDNTPTQRLIPAIAAHLGGRMAEHRYIPGGGVRIDNIFCDPAGNARDQASGMPSVHLMRTAFGDTGRFGQVVKFTKNPKWTWIPNGVALVQGALSPADGSPPRLYVARNLASGKPRGIVKALRGYSYPEAKGNRPQSDIPVHDAVFSHAVDALRYGVVGLHLESGHQDADVWNETRLTVNG